MALVRPPSSAAPEFPARQLARLERPLRLHRGGVIEQPVVAYETWGRLSAARDNTVLLFTGLSPPAHAASSPADPKPGWWESMIGEGKPIDTRRYFVVCVNSLGSPYGSSSPASVDPRTGRPYGINFPELSVEDIATAGRERDHFSPVIFRVAARWVGFMAGSLTTRPASVIRQESFASEPSSDTDFGSPLTSPASRPSDVTVTSSPGHASAMA